MACKHRRYRALCQSHIDVNLAPFNDHRMVPLIEPEPCEWCKDDDVRGDGIAVALVDLRVAPQEA